MIAFFASWIVAAAYMLLSRKQHGIKLSTKYAFFIIGFVALIGSAFAVNKVDLISGGNAVRKEIYHYSIEMVKSSWLMGVGLGSFQNKIGEISANNLAFQMYGMPFALHPHNLFLAVWLNLGLLGMAVFISILVWFYFGSATIKDNNVKFSLVAAMSSILIHGLFDTTYFKNDLSMIFMIIISILAISRFHEKNN
jgi:O-antigen ligase